MFYFLRRCADPTVRPTPSIARTLPQLSFWIALAILRYHAQSAAHCRVKQNALSRLRFPFTVHLFETIIPVAGSLRPPMMVSACPSLYMYAVSSSLWPLSKNLCTIWPLSCASARAPNDMEPSSVTGRLERDMLRMCLKCEGLSLVRNLWWTAHRPATPTQSIVNTGSKTGAGTEEASRKCRTCI